ncbi:MAG TPA: hypothetical protein VN461_10875 [Vicinamibacteria bacterium]|nr:hypothetical protein [Vicinamibacteria bacterium]
MASDRAPAPEAQPTWGTPGLVLLSLVVALLFVGFMLAATDGHFVPQVVDLYVICQYAGAMAGGHPFQYNPGEPPSTGATSLLHTAVLALAHALGARGEGLIAFVITAGAGLYLGSVLMARRLGALLGGNREGLLAGLLVALGGPVVWGFLYGSDIALFMFLSLWLFERWLGAWAGSGWRSYAAAGSLLALARPEGLLIGLLLGSASLVKASLAKKESPLRRDPPNWLPWLPAAVGLGMLFFQRGLTGSWLGTSVIDKSLLANYTTSDALALVAEYAVDVIRGLLLGFYPSQAPIGFARGWAPFFFPPLALLLILLAAAHLPEPWRRPVRVWLGVVAIVFGLVGPNIFMGVHFNRYLMWAFPGLLVLTAVGLGLAVRLLARGDSALESTLFRTGASLFVLLGLLSTLRFGALYGEMAGEVYRRDVMTAEWITHNLPRGVAMANIATSLEYLTGHRNLNLHGVTSPAFFGNHTAEREAGVFEALGRLPASERPPYLITTSSVQEGSALMRELVEGPPLHQSSSLGDELLIFRMRYDLVGKNGRIFLPETLRAVAGLQETDRLNVCDARDEANHGYRFSSHLGNIRLHGTVRIDAYALPGGSEIVADAGRAIMGEESFQIATQRGRDLVVVMRTASAVQAASMRASGSGTYEIEFPEAGLIVQSGGQTLARLAIRTRPGWNEYVFRLPGSFLGEGHTALRFSGRYGSFYYWFFQ